MKTQQKRNRDVTLNKKELEYLKALLEYKYLTGSLFKRLFNEKSLRTIQYRLHELWNKKLVRRIRLPHLVGEGSPEIIYILERYGLNVIRNDLYLLDSDRVGKNTITQPKGVSQLKHLLLVNNFIVSLEVSSRELEVNIEEIRTYYNKPFTLEYSNKNYTTANNSIIPDAMFILARNEKKALFFLEADRGTEPVRSFGNKDRSNIYQKVDSYTKTLKKRGFIKFGEFTGFRVLFVTTNSQRRDTIRAFISDIANNECFWFTTESEIKEKNILTDAVWCVSDDFSNTIRTLLKPN